jgi:hypothetical protein
VMARDGFAIIPRTITPLAPRTPRLFIIKQVCLLSQKNGKSKQPHFDVRAGIVRAGNNYNSPRKAPLLPFSCEI